MTTKYAKDYTDSLYNTTPGHSDFATREAHLCCELLDPMNYECSELRDPTATAGGPS